MSLSPPAQHSETWDPAVLAQSIACPRSRLGNKDTLPFICCASKGAEELHVCSGRGAETGVPFAPGAQARGLPGGIRARRLLLRGAHSRPAGPAAPAPPPALRQPIARSRLSRRAWPRARAPRRRPAPRPPRPARRMVRAPSAPRPRATPPARAERAPPAPPAGAARGRARDRCPRGVPRGPRRPLAPDNNARPRPRWACGKAREPRSPGAGHAHAVGTKLGPEAGRGPRTRGCAGRREGSLKRTTPPSPPNPP